MVGNPGDWQRAFVDAACEELTRRGVIREPAPDATAAERTREDSLGGGIRAGDRRPIPFAVRFFGAALLAAGLLTYERIRDNISYRGPQGACDALAAADHITFFGLGILWAGIPLVLALRRRYRLRAMAGSADDDRANVAWDQGYAWIAWGLLSLLAGFYVPPGEHPLFGNSSVQSWQGSCELQMPRMVTAAAGAWISALVVLGLDEWADFRMRRVLRRDAGRARPRQKRRTRRS